MEFAARIHRLVRGIRWSLIGPPPTLQWSAWPRVRMKVLHRDGYRCRSCARPGDEITLQVCVVRLRIGRLVALTLCASCQSQAADLVREVESQSITVAERPWRNC
jgi:hypothetical protein